jgi:hypothetical protein
MRLLKMKARGPIGLWLLALGLPFGLGAAELIVPLQFGYPEVARQAEDALGMDSQGAVLIERNACNQVHLSDLRIEPTPPQVRVNVAFTADLGTRLFKRCVGPKNAQGRLHVLLEPTVADEQSAVQLRFVSAELRRTDGSQGLLTRPARVLAERVVLPRLEHVQIDLAEPMRGVDALIQSFAVDEVPLLAERSRLISVRAGEDHVAAEIGLSLGEPRFQSASEAALSEAELEQWQRVEDELDGFISSAIIDLAAAADDRSLQLDLLATLLDTRMAIARTLADDTDGAADPVDPIRDLFVASWDQLRPAVLQLERDGLTPFPGLQLTAFMAGADAIAALDALGPEYGIEISRDGIRRLARMLLAEDTPTSFTPLSLSVDPELRILFALTELGQSQQLESTHWLDWLMSTAHAQEDPRQPALALEGLVARRASLDQYLPLVSELLRRKTQERLSQSSRLPEEVASSFEPLVLATAWKESCWRHYLTEEVPPEVIRSSIGAVGMMQINGRVWRGVYDLEQLEQDIEYNATAGIEILEHYLAHYALRRGEHLQPGGLDNLPRATYAAYNGGPSHLSRYRREGTSARLQAIDRLFWQHFQQFREVGWPDVGSCYAGG